MRRDFVVDKSARSFASSAYDKVRDIFDVLIFPSDKLILACNRAEVITNCPFASDQLALAHVPIEILMLFGISRKSHLGGEAIFKRKKAPPPNHPFSRLPLHVLDQTVLVAIGMKALARRLRVLDTGQRITDVTL